MNRRTPTRASITVPSCAPASFERVEGVVERLGKEPPLPIRNVVKPRYGRRRDLKIELCSALSHAATTASWRRVGLDWAEFVSRIIYGVCGVVVSVQAIETARISGLTLAPAAAGWLLRVAIMLWGSGRRHGMSVK